MKHVDEAGAKLWPKRYKNNPRPKISETPLYHPTCEQPQSDSERTPGTLADTIDGQQETLSSTA